MDIGKTEKVIEIEPIPATAPPVETPTPEPEKVEVPA